MYSKCGKFVDFPGNAALWIKKVANFFIFPQM